LQRKLEIAGIVLLAAGLVTLAFEDPIIRILIYGASIGAGAGARTAFTSGGSSSGSFTTFRTSAAGGAGDLLATFSAFGASVIGLILVVTAALTRGRTTGAPAAKADSKQ